MKLTLNVNGMMCPHCEAKVKKALEALDEVVSAAPDHEKNIVEVELTKEVDSAVFKKAIADQGFEMV